MRNKSIRVRVGGGKNKSRVGVGRGGCYGGRVAGGTAGPELGNPEGPPATTAFTKVNESP